MVAVKVGEQDGLEIGEVEPLFTQGKLRAFGAVEHEELFADVDYLSGAEVAWGWECCAAADDMYVEFFHCKGV